MYKISKNRITKKELIRQIKNALDKNRVKLTDFEIYKIDETRKKFESKILAICSKTGVIKNKPYGTRIILDFKGELK